MNTSIYPYTKAAAMKALGLEEKLQPIDSSGITNMQVDLVSDSSRVLAKVSYNHYGIVVTGIQLMQRDNGIYIQYPNYLKNDGTRQSYFFPVNMAVSKIVEKAIYKEFERKRAELMEKLSWEFVAKKKRA